MSTKKRRGEGSKDAAETDTAHTPYAPVRGKDAEGYFDRDPECMLTCCLYVACPGTPAKLWEMVNGAITCTCTGTLGDVNVACAASDRKLATVILQTGG